MDTTKTFNDDGAEIVTCEACEKKFPEDEMQQDVSNCDLCKKCWELTIEDTPA